MLNVSVHTWWCGSLTGVCMYVCKYITEYHSTRVYVRPIGTMLCQREHIHACMRIHVMLCACRNDVYSMFQILMWLLTSVVIQARRLWAPWCTHILYETYASQTVFSLKMPTCMCCMCMSREACKSASSTCRGWKCCMCLPLGSHRYICVHYMTWWMHACMLQRTRRRCLRLLQDEARRASTHPCMSNRSVSVGMCMYMYA